MIIFFIIFFSILDLRDDILFERILKGTGKYFILWIKTEEAIEPFSILRGLCGDRLYWAFQTGAENVFPLHNLKLFKASVGP